MKNISLKLMGLGISIMLAAIYIRLEPGLAQRMYGNEVFIALLGFIVSVIGFIKRD